jgi:hypothetical protein
MTSAILDEEWGLMMVVVVNQETFDGNQAYIDENYLPHG